MIFAAFGTLSAVAAPAHAACTTVSSNQIVCVGDVTQANRGVTTSNTGTGATSITATGTITGTSGDGIYANNASSATDMTINVVTVNGGKSGILAQNAGTGITSITATGTVTGTTAYGIFAVNDTSAKDLIINAATVTGNTGGIYADNGGTGATRITASGTVTGVGKMGGIHVNNDSTATDAIINAVTVNGDIYVNNQGTGMTSITVSDTVTGTDAIYVSNYGTDLSINAATVSGKNIGIHAENRGTGTTSITATGAVTGADGIDVSSYGTDLSINAATVTSKEDGIHALNNGTGTTSITATGTITGADIYGIDASSYGTDLSINVAAVTGGKDGIHALNNGTGATSITATGAVTGTGGNGIYAENNGTGATSITTGGDVTGNSSSGISALNGINAADLTVTVNSGTVSGSVAGVMAEHAGNGNNTVILASVTSIQGGTKAGVVMITASGNQLLNSAAEISSLNDVALSSTNTSGSTVVNNAGVMTGMINMTGTDITFNNEAYGVLSMRDFSSGSKADPISNFGGSAVFNNAGTIRFDDANNDGTLTHGTLSGIATFNHSGTIDLSTNGLAGNTLTISGQFVSNGGSVYLNTLLDDASSNGGIGTSDRLILTDVTTGSGATKLYIQPTSGSLGALTTGNGIRVVEVQGTSSGDAFALGKPVTAGLYEYVLNQGSDQSWYLSSYLQPESEQELGTASALRQSPLSNPAIGAYLSNQTAATTLFMHTLYDRQGHLNNLAGTDKQPQSGWVRVVTRHGTGESVGGSQETRTNSDVVHLGVDVGTWQVQDGNLHAGIMGAYGKSKTRVTSKATGTWAEGRLDGYSLGVYGTWFADEAEGRGLYVDGWTQYSWFKNKINGSAQVKGEEKYDSRLWTISAEAGYGFLIGKTANTEIMLTPQVQIAYNDYSADNHTDSNDLRVNGDKGSGTVTRVGARLYGRSTSAFTARPFVEVNWIYSDARNTLNFNGEVLRDDVPHNRLEAKLGIEGSIAKNWTLWGQAGVQWGKDSYHRYEGQFGLKYQW